MHIEIDSTKLYRRSYNGSEVKMLCSNCFLNECVELGCIGSTNDGNCECGNHSDHV